MGRKLKEEKRKKVSFTTGEDIIEMLDFLIQSSKGVVPIQSRSHLIELLIKSFCYQVLNGYNTFLYDVEDIKEKLEANGFNRNTLTVLNSDSAYQYVEYQEKIEKQSNAIEKMKQDAREMNETVERKKAEKKALEEEIAKLKAEREKYGSSEATFKDENRNHKQHEVKRNTKEKSNNRRKRNKSREVIATVDGVVFVDVLTDTQIEILTKENYQDKLQKRGYFVQMSEDGELEISGKTIGVLKKYGDMEFEGYEENTDDVKEIVKEADERITEDDEGNKYFIIGLTEINEKKYKNYEYPKGIGQYGVIYISSKNEQVVDKYMFYNDKPMKTIDKNVIDYLIAEIAEETETTYKALFKQVNREDELKYFKEDLANNRTPMIRIIE
ncbi:hypothetical protein [Staphylococcus cohnii]|uniref:hypothetical protein n=1 Tax=Staphylococcus cohnii TaxID=29382 RepID=UPI003D7EE960